MPDALPIKQKNSYKALKGCFKVNTQSEVVLQKLKNV